MQICTSWSCLMPGIIAILVALAAFYILGIFIGHNSTRDTNNRSKSVRDKDAHAHRADRETRNNPNDSEKFE